MREDTAPTSEGEEHKQLRKLGVVFALMAGAPPNRIVQECRVNLNAISGREDWGQKQYVVFDTVVLKKNPERYQESSVYPGRNPESIDFAIEFGNLHHTVLSGIRKYLTVFHISFDMHELFREAILGDEIVKNRFEEIVEAMKRFENVRLDYSEIERVGHLLEDFNRANYSYEELERKVKEIESVTRRHRDTLQELRALSNQLQAQNKINANLALALNQIIGMEGAKE